MREKQLFGSFDDRRFPYVCRGQRGLDLLACLGHTSADFLSDESLGCQPADMGCQAADLGCQPAMFPNAVKRQAARDQGDGEETPSKYEQRVVTRGHDRVSTTDEAIPRLRSSDAISDSTALLGKRSGTHSIVVGPEAPRHTFESVHFLVHQVGCVLDQVGRAPDQVGLTLDQVGGESNVAANDKLFGNRCPVLPGLQSRDRQTHSPDVAWRMPNTPSSSSECTASSRVQRSFSLGALCSPSSQQANDGYNGISHASSDRTKQSSTRESCRSIDMSACGGQCRQFPRSLSWDSGRHRTSVV